MKRELRKAILEYYKWNGDQKIKPVKLLQNVNGAEMALVRFTDAPGDEMSSLMSCMEWKSGKWDVTEMCVFWRECEDYFVGQFMKGEKL